MAGQDDYGRRTRMTALTRSIGDLIGRLDPTGEHTRVQMGAAAAWRDIAGPAVTSHAVAVYVRGSELIVEMDSAAWATDITFLADRYREAVNERLGDESVKSVRIVVSKRRRPAY